MSILVASTVGLCSPVLTYAQTTRAEEIDMARRDDAVRPPKFSGRFLTHAFDGDFSIIELTPAEVAHYFCPPPAGQPADRIYYGVLFRFKRTEGGALGLLWTRENGRWKLLSFEEFDL